MAINAGDVVWNIGGETKGLDKALRNSSKAAGKLAANFKKHSRAIGIGMTAAGAVITASLGKAVTSFVSTGDAIQKMAIRTGASTEAISELGFAAEQSGSSMEAIGKGFKAQSSFIEDAKDGLSTATLALDKLGLSITTLEGQSPEQAFMTLSGAIASIEDPMQRAALAQDVFSRSGNDLLPLFASGAQGISDLRLEAEALGISMSQDQADAAAQFGDSLNSLKKSLGSVGLQIGNALVPMLNELLPKITGIVTNIISWMRENPVLIKTISLITAGIGFLMTAVGPLLIMLPGIVAAFGLLTAPLLASAGSFIAIGAAIVGGLVAAFLILKPILEGAQKWMSKNWDAIKNIFITAKDGLLTIMKSLSVILGVAIKAVISVMQGFGKGVGEAFGGVVKSSGEGSDGFIGSIQQMADLFASIANVILEAMNEFSAFMDKHWIDIQNAVAWSVKNMFNPLMSFIGMVWDMANGVSKGINFVIDKINNFIDAINNLIGAFNNLSGLNIPGIPRLANGGVIPGFASGGQIQGLASGGKIQNRIVKVGERGPELMAAPVGGRVLSHPDMMRAASNGFGQGSSGGGNNIAPVFNVTISGNDDPDALLEKLKQPFSRWMTNELNQALI